MILRGGDGASLFSRLLYIGSNEALVDNTVMTFRTTHGDRSQRKFPLPSRQTLPRAQVSDGAIFDRLGDRLRRPATLTKDDLSGDLASRRPNVARQSAAAPSHGVVPPAFLDSTEPVAIHFDSVSLWADDDTLPDIGPRSARRPLPHPYRQPTGRPPRAVNAGHRRRLGTDRAGWVAFAAALAVLVGVLAASDRPLPPAVHKTLARAKAQLSSSAALASPMPEAEPQGNASSQSAVDAPVVEPRPRAAGPAGNSSQCEADGRMTSSPGHAARRGARSERPAAHTQAAAPGDDSTVSHDDDEVMPLDIEAATAVRPRGAQSRAHPAPKSPSLKTTLPGTFRPIDLDDPFRHP